MVGMKNRAAAAVLRARRSARPRGRADEADDQGDPVSSALNQRGQRPVVTGRVPQGVPTFLTLALELPLTIVFARLSAAVFETPFLRRRSSPQDAGQPHSRAEGAPG